MGYELHITRADHWAESHKQPITLEEWKLYIEKDPEMRLDQVASATTTKGELIETFGEGLAVWTAYSRNKEDGNLAWINWWRGQITVKNPDPEIIRKMAAIAFALNAKLQGDDGEYYG